MIELIAGTPPGGGQDRVARAVAAALDELGQAAEVSNMAGRGGANGWDRLARNPADPHLVAVSSPTLVTNDLLGLGATDHETLTPLPTLCTEYMAFVVAEESSIISADAFLEHLSRPPTRPVSLATAAGNINHMTLGMVARHAGIQPNSVPIRVFDSARKAVADVLAGQTIAAVVSAASAVPEIEAGSLRAIAVSSPARLSAPYDGVPAWVELGVAVTLGTWRGLVGTPDLGPRQVNHWDTLARNLTATPAWQAALTSHRWEPTLSTAGETRAMLGRVRRDYLHILTDLEMIS